MFSAGFWSTFWLMGVLLTIGSCMLYSCCSRLQLSFSENGHWSSSEEKEKVAETDDTCYGKEIGFGSQPMKIAEASSRIGPRFLEIVR